MKMTKLCDTVISEFSSAIKYDATSKMYPMDNPGRMHHGMIFTLTGTELYKFGNITVRAEPNSVVYLPKGAVYDITLEGEESSVITINFELEKETDIPPFRIDFPDGNCPDTLFLKALMEWNGKKTAYRSSCFSLLYNIFSACAKKEESFIHPGKYEKIREAVEYLHSHYTEQNFRIDSLSQMSGMNPAYFARIFNEKFGMPPKEYVMNLKLRQARELLAGEKYTIAEISAMLGYSDVYHFSKSFKKGTEMSPGEWRKGEGKQEQS